MSEKLLINERPLTLLPSLVKHVGLERAVILQQVHFICQQPKSGKDLDGTGEKWTWNTYEQWHEEHFTFWTARNIRNHFQKLEAEGLLLSRQPHLSDGNATKFYRLDYDRIAELAGGACVTPMTDGMCHSNDTPSVTPMTHLIKETKTSTNTSFNASVPKQRKPKITENHRALTRDEAIACFSGIDAYTHIDISREVDAMEKWLAKQPNRVLNKAMATAWLDKIPNKPIEVESEYDKLLRKWKRYHATVYHGEVRFRPELYKELAEYAR